MADKRIQRAVIDDSTLAVNTIDYSHHEVHEGSMFIAAHEDLDFDTGQTITISFKTPNTSVEQHVVLDAFCSGDATLYVYEGPTITDDTGTPTAPYNFNRRSTNESGILDNVTPTPTANRYVKDATITVTGTTLLTQTLAAGSGINRVLAGPRNMAELILNKNTVYAFRITCGATSNLVARLQVIWYEHTPIY